MIGTVNEARRNDRHPQLITKLADSMKNPKVKAQFVDTMANMAIPPDAIARAIAFAIEQPANVDVNEIIVRPTAQG